MRYEGFSWSFRTQLFTKHTKFIKGFNVFTKALREQTRYSSIAESPKYEGIWASYRATH